MTKILFCLIFILSLYLPSFSQEISIPFRPVPAQPYFESPQVTIDSAEYNTLVLRIEAKQNGTARLFWATHYDMQFNQPKSIWFSLKSGERNYYFNIPSQNPNWIGWIKGFLIYPEIDNKLIEIKQAEIIQGNLLTNIRSGWQEFWGPKGRTVIGSTINLIPSSSIFGKSVNIYIYWIIGVFFVLFLAFQLYQNKGNFNLSFENSIKKTFVLALAFWILLALNSDLNFFKIFKGNFSKYFGKTIEQKRAIAYGKDYYDFLVFAKEKLPKEPVEFGLLSSRYAASLQARIYLVPHVYIDNPDKDFLYLLLFHPSSDRTFEQKNYKTLTKLDEDKIILKRFEK